ncbi:MAG: LUD domain-containing protein [Desulfarculaceae bacterium]|nr:LUD domain-containing protein [Desulfarculaceae bacterium]
MARPETIKQYRKRVQEALENPFLRQAMDNFAVAYRTGRANAFKGLDVQDHVRKVADIKQSCIKQWRRLFEQFKEKALENNIHVHLADTAEDACRIIESIAADSGSKKIVKSKSMTAEEIHLNAWLEKEGLEVTETDLGEWIVQLRKEGPSHMVMPAIHLSRNQVADLFSDVTGKKQEVDIDQLVKVARKELREKYFQADMGITGANFVIADTGTIGITTNEGNARLVTTLPGVHVAVAGIDKLLPSISEALFINRVLPKNATGQQITSYVTWITGPSECTVAEGGKREMHMVFLDNGRSKLAGDDVFSQALSCIRCGACANVCPVYRMVGGHRMGHVYIGAIGLITTYFFHGIENARHIAKNCTGCGACKEVCAAGIDLPELIKGVQDKIRDRDGHPVKGMLLKQVLKNRRMFHGLLRSASIAQKPFSKDAFLHRHLPMIFSKEQDFRAIPAVVSRPFRDRFEKIVPAVESPTVKIALFSGCLQDFVYPEHLEAAMASFERAGADVKFPMDQTCCGLPALMMGEGEAARSVAVQNIMAFKELDLDYIVTLCASCASHLTHKVPKLAGERFKEEALAFSEKVIPYSVFLDRMSDEAEYDVSAGQTGQKVAWHAPCHLIRGLGISREPKDVISRRGFRYVATCEEETCCGLAGSYSVDFPLVSKEILAKKLADVEQSGADILATECPGCVLQLRGGAVRQGLDIRVLHVSEVLS